MQTSPRNAGKCSEYKISVVNTLEHILAIYLKQKAKVALAFCMDGPMQIFGNKI